MLYVRVRATRHHGQYSNGRVPGHASTMVWRFSAAIAKSRLKAINLEYQEVQSWLQKSRHRSGDSRLDNGTVLRGL